MSYTSRWSLSAFGGGLDGALGDDDQKYTSADRLTLDRLLAAFEGHNHSGGDQVTDPTAAPGLTVLSDSGYIGAGQTRFYVVTYVDQFGLESAPSDEISIATPPPITLTTPLALALQTGGSLAPGVYYYGYTGLTAAGEETDLSPVGQIIIDTGSGSYSVAVTLPPLPAGIATLRLWRQPASERGYTKVGDFTASGTVVDNGSVPNDPCSCDPGHGPPATNETNAANAIRVDLPAADVSYVTTNGSPVHRWRIYRAEHSGAYGGGLVHEVVETTDPSGLGPLVSSWTDLGLATLPGFPPPRSQTLRPSVLLPTSFGAQLPTVTTALPDGMLFILVQPGLTPVTYALLDRTWTVVGGGGGGPYAAGQGPIFYAPGGTQWRFGVDDTGHPTFTEVGP